MVKNLAIIPARSGSKRVPNKNIIDFMGKPMMAYTIEAALESGVFTEVVVSTDSPEYAEIAIKYGASVPFLRDECNDDYCTIADVTAHVLKTLSERLGQTYDNFASLQVSCPLRDSQIIKDVYNRFEESNAYGVATCFPFNFMNPWWAFKMKDETADFILSSPSKSRSQDNEQLYCPTGAVYFQRNKPVSEHAGGGKTILHPIDWKYAVDIDNNEDIEMAKAAYLILKNLV